MQLLCILHRQRGFTLPLSYHEIIQQFFYQSLYQTEIASFLRQEGLRDGNRKMKLFAFSRLIGNYTLNYEHRTITFHGDAVLVFASPVDLIIWELARTLLNNSTISLADIDLQVKDVFFEDIHPSKDQMEVQMLSPITVYQTHTSDGRKRTVYFDPFDSNFQQLISENLRRKYRIIFGEDPCDGAFSIEPVEVSCNDKKILRFRDTVVQGWMGKYRITGDPRLLKIALDAGLGSKNSQGFGLAVPTDSLFSRIAVKRGSAFGHTEGKSRIKS